MKPAACNAVLPLPAPAPALETRSGALALRCADLVALTKPRIAVLVLFTVAAGALMAGHEAVELLTLVNVVCGTALVAAGASALNQLLERHNDALMRRTEQRPLPAGRLQPGEVLAFGLVLAAAGLVWLAATMKHPMPVAIAAFTLAGYVLVYTPLKQYTTLNTLVGAVPGALPPVIGWSAVTGGLEREALALFLVLFFWQVPHFLAIAWIYREDYGRAGLQMLPVRDPAGAATGRQMLMYCLGLIPVSLLPAGFQQAGLLYTLGALALGLAFTAAAYRFVVQPGESRARVVLLASLVYLPALLALLLVDLWLK